MAPARVMASGKLLGEMVIILIRFDSRSGHIISHFHHNHKTGRCDHDRVQSMHCLGINATRCMYSHGH